jgi:outer membrane protein TolC
MVSMTSNFKKSLVVFLVCTSFITVDAQTKKTPIKESVVVAPSAVPSDSILDLEQQLLPLDEILEIAVKHSPYINYDLALIERQKNMLTVTKREWHRVLSAQAFYSWGNQALNYGSENGGYSYNILNGYRYGFNLNIPLSEFTSRNARVKADKAELDAARYKREQTEMMLRRQVIEEYNQLLAAQKLLKIKTDGSENARVMYEVADKKFRSGGIQLDDMTKANDALVAAQTAQVLSVAEYRILLLSFEELIGVKLNTIKK